MKIFIKGKLVGNKIKNYILYGDTDRESYLEVKKSIERSNTEMSMVFSSVAFVLVAMMFILSFFIEGFMNSRLVYLFGVLFCASLLIMAVLSKKYTILSYIGVYTAFSGFLIYGIALGTITRPEEQTVTFMVMMMLLPLIFVDKPIRIAGCISLYVVIFIVLAYQTKEGSVLSADVSDAIIFGLLAIASGSIVIRSKIKGYVLERKLHKMSETDQLTGLNNRNCYELRMEVYPGRARKSIACIYVDVNGLHQLNNTEGHKAGDAMLRFVASEMQRQFGEDDTYRIGGDEFVAFALDTDEAHIKDKIKGLTESVTAASYHVAVGYDLQKAGGIDIDQLIRNAETGMYKDKSEYYKSHDRRSR